MKKIITVTENETTTVELRNVDVSLDQIFDALKGLLVAATWNEETINQFIIEWAEELKER